MRASRFADEGIPLDFLVEVRARHVEGTRRLADVPVELAELRQQDGALGGISGLLERAQVADPDECRRLARRPPDQPLDVLVRYPRPCFEDQQPLLCIPQLPALSRPLYPCERVDR